MAYFQRWSLNVRPLFLCAAVWALVGFAGDGRSLGAPPTAVSSADLNGFNALAKDIEARVLGLGYPKSTADDLARLVRGWKLEAWKQKLAQVRSNASSKQPAEVIHMEDEATRALYETIGKEIAFPRDNKKDSQYFYLSVVVKDRKAQCLGFAQMFYILGNSIGLTVRVIEVLELASGPLPAAEGHVACMVERSDGRSMIVDLAHHSVSRLFVFEEAYVETGNFWRYKQSDPPPGIHPRIRYWNDREIIAGLCSNLASVHTIAGHYERVIPFCDKAIELNPLLSNAYANRANAYNRLGQFQRAVADCNKAIEINPQFALAFNNRACAHGNLGRHKQAISDFNKAIELKPNYVEAFIGRGRTYGKLGQYQQVIADCIKAIQLDPKIADAFYIRGCAYSSLGLNKQAISDFSKAIELEPRHAEAFCNRGRAHGKLGQYQQAVADCAKAIELDPKYPLAYFDRGIINAALGKMDDARSDLKESLMLDPALKPDIQKVSDQFELGL
jgi:tetratricopeptide (TPR) repeat protein